MTRRRWSFVLRLSRAADARRSTQAVMNLRERALVEDVARGKVMRGTRVDLADYGARPGHRAEAIRIVNEREAYATAWVGRRLTERVRRQGIRTEPIQILGRSGPNGTREFVFVLEEAYPDGTS